MRSVRQRPPVAVTAGASRRPGAILACLAGAAWRTGALPARLAGAIGRTGALPARLAGAIRRTSALPACLAGATWRTGAPPARLAGAIWRTSALLACLAGAIRRTSALLACLAGALAFSPFAAASGAEVVDARFDSAPHRLVRAKSEELLELIEASRDYVDDDPERFMVKVDALLSPVIDFRGFARGVMSVHYRKATADQRKRFVDNFKASLLRTYALMLTRFEDGDVVVLPPDGPPRRPNRQNVKMEIRTGGNVHPVIYTMNQGKDGAWRIGNIVIAGINIGLTFRSQFKSAVSDAKYGGNLNRVIDAWAGVVAVEGARIPDGKAET